MPSPPPAATPAMEGKSLLTRGVALRAARPWSFPATVGPVLLGTAAAFQVDDAFNPLLLGFTLITTLGVHAAGNLMNTLFDFVNGFDSPSSSDLTLVNGILSVGQVKRLIAAAYGIAVAAAAPLCLLSRAKARSLLSMVAAGAASAFVYTGGPGLKYKALGDVLITATFGPLLVCFSYLAQAGTLSWYPLMASLPLALQVEAILHANNARDAAEDKANGVLTLSGLLGESASRWLYAALVAVPFAEVLRQTWRSSILAALPLVAVPTAARLVSDCFGGLMRRLPMRTAKLQFLFGLLLSGSLVARVLLPLPPLATIFGRLLA